MINAMHLSFLESLIYLSAMRLNILKLYKKILIFYILNEIVSLRTAQQWKNY
jgi:hypothetical protein